MNKQTTFVIQLQTDLGEWIDARDSRTDDGRAEYHSLDELRSRLQALNIKRQTRIVERTTITEDRVLDTALQVS